MSTSYHVRIYDVFAVPSTKMGAEPARRLRWNAQGRSERCSRTYPNKPAAESFRADLLAARNAGEPFDVESGLPLSILRREEKSHTKKAAPTHFEAAQEYAGMKWPDMSGKSRETNANVLAAITMTLVGDRPLRPDDDDLWKVLYSYAFAPATWHVHERPNR